MNHFQTIGRVFLLSVASLVMAGATTNLQAQSSSNVIELQIKGSAISVDHKELLISDVAELSGGRTKIRKLAGNLDLDELSLSRDVVVTSGQIRARLLVEGFPAENIKVTGPQRIQVRFIKQDDLHQRIESKIESELSRQFGVGIADVQVHLSPKTDLSQISDAIDVRQFEAMAIFPSKLPLGDKTIQVEFTDTKGQRLSTRINVQIIVMKEMVVTSSSVARGTVITASHVQTVKRPMASGNAELATVDCIGCTAIRDIPPYEIVSSRYVTKQQQQKQAVVKQNSLVDILLVRGRMNIRMRNAKALTSGAVGETIQVLNTESNKRISAIVKDQSTVVVRF